MTDASQSTSSHHRRRIVVGAIAGSAVVALAFAAGTWVGGIGDDDGNGDDTDTAEGWLLTVEAESGTSADGDLRLTDVARSNVAFSDRPDRTARAISVDGLVDEWTELFGDDPPNAVVSWGGRDRAQGAVVELAAPQQDGEALVFPYVVITDGMGSDVELADASLRPDLDATMTDVRLFIDSADLPQLPEMCDLDVEQGDGGITGDFDVLVQFIAVGDPNTPTTISWGDGSQDETLAVGAQLMHSYGGDGTYTIEASGGCDWSGGVVFPDPSYCEAIGGCVSRSR